MNMREAFEAYWNRTGYDKATWHDDEHRYTYMSAQQQAWVSWKAGYAAAIEAVKAGMPRYFYHPVTGAEIGPCYKLPEDV